MKPALLVIDIQNEFLPNMSEQDKKTAFDYINGAIRRFHDKGFPVIRIYQAGPKPGSEAFEFPPSVLIKPEDPMIVKTYSNAFTKTGLEKLLKEKGCNMFFIPEDGGLGRPFPIELFDGRSGRPKQNAFASLFQDQGRPETIPLHRFRGQAVL